MWKSTQIGRIVLMLTLGGSVLCSAGVAQADEQSGICLIIGVAAFSTRVHVRCGNGSELPKVICNPGHTYPLSSGAIACKASTNKELVP